MQDQHIDFLVDTKLNITEEFVNPAMATDYYQLAMCASYLLNNKENELAVFNMFYRKNPFNGSFGIFMGLARVIKFLTKMNYTGKDIDFLKKSYNMPDKLWEYLREFKFTGTCEALKEGNMIQPYIPIIQIKAPLPMANLIETQLLTLTGYPTMVGTKSARITAQSTNPWVELGLRGASDVYSSIEASRAAYICGASGTSNIAAHQIYGVPASGTMSHAFIMAYTTQLDAFIAYGKIFRQNSIFLIDTYNHVQGTKDAIKAAKKLKINTFRGVRDDSGDLASHSQDIRKILDDNGFPNVKIFVSNEIDEYKRHYLVQQNNKIDADGCGRNVVTMPDSGMVYKLVQTDITYPIKLSANEEKVTDPGTKKVYRFVKDGYYDGDLIALAHEQEKDIKEITERNQQKYICKKESMVPLLHTHIRKGVSIYKSPTIDELKHFVSREMRMIRPEMLELSNKFKYPVYISKRLKSIKEILIRKFNKC